MSCGVGKHARFWHEANIGLRGLNVSCGGKAGHMDPKRTSKTAGKYPLVRSRFTNDLTYWPRPNSFDCTGLQMRSAYSDDRNRLE